MGGIWLLCSEEGDHLRALLLAKFAPEAVAELLEVSEETAQRYREQSAPIGENRLAQLTELFLEAQSRMKYLSSARAALELCTVRACRPAEGVDMESVLARLEALEAMPRAAAPRAEESPKKPEPRAAKAALQATEAARPSAPATAPEPAPEEYGRALEALVAAKPMLRPQLSAMKFERREGNCIFTTFAKSAAMQMTLLERFRPQIEEALAEAFGEPMSLRMRREDERPKGLDRPCARSSPRRRTSSAWKMWNWGMNRRWRGSADWLANSSVTGGFTKALGSAASRGCTAFQNRAVKERQKFFHSPIVLRFLYYSASCHNTGPALPGGFPSGVPDPSG